MTSPSECSPGKFQNRSGTSKCEECQAGWGAGYSCMMAALVGSWRQLWSSTPGTTASDAPFGLVTLAPSGGEGGSDVIYYLNFYGITRTRN